MTLGPSSSSSLSAVALVLTLTTGCSFDVAGTGGQRPDPSNDGTSNETTTASGGTNLPSDSSKPEQGPGPTDYEALFDAPPDPTTTDDLVTGVWAGRTNYGEVRLKITADKVVIAMKCGDAPAVGMEVGSVVTDAKLRMLASKSAGTGACSIKVTPIEIIRCPDSYTTDCFDILDGTRLKFFGTPPFTGGGASSYEYTKLSD